MKGQERVGEGKNMVGKEQMGKRKDRERTMKG
jgi:hypothetical protein